MRDKCTFQIELKLIDAHIAAESMLTVETGVAYAMETGDN